MSGDGFLKRWSRRKRTEERAPPASVPAEAADPAATPVVGAPPAAPVASPQGPAAPPAEAPVDPATLPPIESLGAGSDYTVFLRRGVPDVLRRAALRRAWETDPVIRDFRTPADYDWDFNAPEWSTPLSTEESRALLDKILPSADPAPAAVPAATPTVAPAAGPAIETPAPPPAEAPVAPAPAQAAAVPAAARAPENSAPRPLPAPSVPAVDSMPPSAETPQETAPIRRHGGALPR